MHWINRHACLLGGGEGQGKAQAQPGCLTLLRVRRRMSSGAHLEWVGGVGCRSMCGQPGARSPGTLPHVKSLCKGGHGSNFLCRQGAWPMYGRWSDSDSSLIKGRHFKQWNRPKPPVAFNGFNASRFLGIAGQPVCRNAGEGFKDWEIPQETTRIPQGLSFGKVLQASVNILKHPSFKQLPALTAHLPGWIQFPQPLRLPFPLNVHASEVSSWVHGKSPRGNLWARSPGSRISSHHSQWTP